MRSLAVLIAFDWAALLFYGVSPLTTSAQYAEGALGLAAVCAVAAAWGAAVAIRCARAGRRGAAPVRPDRSRP